MIRKFWLSGSVALMFLLGTLFLAAPAQAAEACDTTVAGTQAYAECVARGGDTTGRVADQGGPLSPPTETSSSGSEMWQLALAGVIGAGVAIGGAVGVSRLGQRQRATAH